MTDDYHEKKKARIADAIKWMCAGHMYPVNIEPTEDKDRIKLWKECRQTKTKYELTVNVHDVLAWSDGTFIQNVWPALDSGQREFIKMGTTPEEYEAMFTEDEK